MRTPKKRKTPKKSRASSLKQAAGILGVPAELLKRAKAAGCPGFDSHNRVDTDQVHAWLREHADELSLSAKEQAKARKEELQAERLEFDLAVKRGEYTRNDVLAARLTGLAASQLTILRQKLENEYPSIVAGLVEPAQIRVYGKRVVDDICARMQGLVGEWS